MRTAIIGNPRAAAGRVGKTWEHLTRAVESRFGPCATMMTTHSGAATELARRAAAEGAQRIVVVGGDGTLGEVVNGLFDPATGRAVEHAPALLLLPAGTASDFARTLGSARLPLDRLLGDVVPRRVDVGRVDLALADGRPVSRWFINEASVGASAVVVDKVNTAPKLLGGRASFFIGTLRGLSSWRTRRLRIVIADDVAELDATLVAVANGRFFGGGMAIAPEAALDDGELDIVAIRDAGLGTFLCHGRKLYRGEHLDLPEVSFCRGRRVQVSIADDPTNPVPVETDGESTGFLPATFSVLPSALVVLSPAAEGPRAPRADGP